ncbi:MAG: uroporphyrinogen decarboxylase family protein [Promethearchaeia archaeon]
MSKKKKEHNIKNKNIKKRISHQLDDLNVLLFGKKKEKWWLFAKWPLHVYNMINILVKGRPNIPLMRNIIKTYAKIGVINVNKLLFQQIRIVDEMIKIHNIPSKKQFENVDVVYNQKIKPKLLPEAKVKEDITSYERFNKALKFKEPDRVPITPLMDYYYAANNNMSPRDFVLGPFEYVFTAVKNTYNRFNGVLDMVHLPMGRLYAFYNMLPLATSGFYGELYYPDEIPGSLQFIEKGYIDVKDFKKIKKLGLRSIWRLVNLKKIRDTLADLVKIGKYIDYWENKKKVPIYATSGIVTPLEGLCYLMGITNWSKALRKNKEDIKELCNLLLKGTMANNFMMYSFSHVERTYICLERVSASFISPKIFEELVLDDLLIMIKENVRNNLTTVLHMDTDWTPFFEYFLEFPKNGRYIMHLEDSDIFKAKEILGDRFCLMGNIQTKLLRFGTEKQIIEKTKELIEGCKEGGGYMMAEGCEIAPDTPMKNMRAWINATLKYGTY